jgi:mRNA-degrading endonuclease RelE of RelBE toxin-antitoxin system
MARIELSRRAQRDLRSLRGAARDFAAELSRALEEDGPAANADIVALRGRSPWLRLRLGDYRVLFRPLEAGEVRALGVERGYLVARIVHRRELERAVAALR